MPRILGKVAEDVRKTIRKKKPEERDEDARFDRVVSTGCTLLDLAISGRRVRGGGIPAGILVEIFGPAGVGKTALLASICGEAQHNRGDVLILDPEARLDREYARVYGLDLRDLGEYKRPDTVSEMFGMIRGKLKNWKETEEASFINVIGTDSTAALTTEAELEDSDAYGGKRAKEFSEGCRVVAREISQATRLIVFTNQIRDKFGVQFGDKKTTPGGHAVPFYSSLRIQIKQVTKLSREKTIKKVKLKNVFGIHSLARIYKSQIDAPYREADIFIVFDPQYGLDDIRGNLIYLKHMTKSNMYPAIDQEFQALDEAIAYIEADLDKRNELLREEVIDTWEQFDRDMRVDRKPKPRRFYGD
jgi:recombination protein RecA